MGENEKKTDYGNWVPDKMMRKMWGAAGVIFLLWIINWIFLRSTIFAIIFGFFFLLMLAVSIYMQRCRSIFSFEKGGLMGEIHEYLVNRLPYNGDGTLLDIGCGAGALTIRCAKRFPEAKLQGVDYWGKEWNYAKAQCESNAAAEGVSDRVLFEEGDAANLKYPSESFDAAVSNFVFHEVKTQPDKRLVVKEALRVVKKGGAFAFQDLFGMEALYGDMEAFVEELKAEGIQEIHYIADIERLGFVPKFVQAPWMLKGIGIIYGIK